MPGSRSNRSSLWFLAVTLLSFLAASTAPTPLYHPVSYTHLTLPTIYSV